MPFSLEESKDYEFLHQYLDRVILIGEAGDIFPAQTDLEDFFVVKIVTREIGYSGKLFLISGPP